MSSGVRETGTERLSLERAETLVDLALAAVEREFPNQVHHVMFSPADMHARPRMLTPAFFGCYDWHSAVHSHWSLARFVRLFPESERAAEARAALSRALTADHLEAELSYLQPRPAFERPYGLAWLLLLQAELTPTNVEYDRAGLAALAELAWDRLLLWLERLRHPVRSGTHDQSAFAMGLMLDAADSHARSFAIREHAERLHLADRDYPLHLEPSGEDFLSPSLGSADLMRRVVSAPAFGEWLQRVFPALAPTAPLLPPVSPTDRSDGRQAHLDGLCLSRAFMLDGVRSALAADDPRHDSLAACAADNERAGLLGLTESTYAGAHWLGTFAMYLLSERGLD